MIPIERNEIIVYLTGTKSDNFVSSVSAARDNAIIIHYNPEKGVLTKIAGKRGSAANLPNEIMAIGFQELTQYVDVLSMASIRNGDYRRLQSGEWSRLRAAIIRAIPTLESTIETLEDIQLRQPVISANVAVIYDTFHSIVEIFNPKGIKSLNETMDRWREGITGQFDQKPSVSPSDLIVSLGDAIRGHDVVDSFETLDQQIEAAFQQRLDEIDNVSFDARTGLPGTIPDPTQPINETAFKFRFSDVEAQGRKLIIWMAHQKGHHRTDLLGSDLIYQHETNQSIVFIQHKRFKENKSWKLNVDDAQLQLMLETCMAQGICHNYKMDDECYMPSSQMRLYDCPVFYKLLRHDAQIEAGTRSSSGIYVQACRARQLMEEHRGSISRETVRDNGIYLESFSELFRRAQLGSRSASYGTLKQRILDHLLGRTEADRIVTIAEEVAV